MKLARHWPWLVGLVGLIALVAVACEDGDDGVPSELQTDFGVTATEIILGLTIVQSGAVEAAAYAPIATTMQAYFAKVNAEDGGVCDRQIRLIVEDDQYAPAPSLERARKLVEQDQVLAFVGNVGTNAVSGHVDFVNDPNGDGDTSDGIPHLFLSTGAAKWDDPETWPWTIGYIPGYIPEGNILATYLNENFPGQTVAILYQNDEFGEDGRAGFKEVFEGEIVAEESYDVGVAEVTSQMANLRDADPDILYFYSLPLTTAQAFRFMEANDWHPQVLWGYVNVNTIMATLLGGPEAGNALIAGTISTNFILDPVADTDDPAMVEHVRIMETYDGPDPAQLSIYAQTLAELMVETLTRACENNDLTRAGVLAAAESIQGFVSDLYLPGVEVNLSSSDHAALEALVPVQVQEDGTLATLGELINMEE